MASLFRTGTMPGIIEVHAGGEIMYYVSARAIVYFEERSDSIHIFVQGVPHPIKFEDRTSNEIAGFHVAYKTALAADPLGSIALKVSGTITT